LKLKSLEVICSYLTVSKGGGRLAGGGGHVSPLLDLQTGIRMMTTSLPIACTLPLGAYAGRVGSIAALNQAFLRSYRHVGLVLELVYEPGAAPKVRELIEQEQECCAFLRFDLHESGDEIRLTIHAPLEASEAIDAVFAPFLAGATAEDGPRSGLVVEPPDLSGKVHASLTK
jgi:hypothetical protein